jgi:preprotein translocase subunit SecE
MNRLVAYLKDTYNELVFKVSWPTREELSGSTIIVLIASLIIAMVVFAMDSVFEWIVRFLYGIF